MPELSEALEQVEHALQAAIDATARAVAPVGVAHVELIDPLRASAAGGKRLRAALVVAAHEACGGSHALQAAQVAAAVELFQAAALIHDDVLDDSPTRRGKPAAHVRVANLHARQGWLGDASAFGAAGGVLIGDLALMAAHRTLVTATASLPSAMATQVAALFADMESVVTAGQYLDMRVAAQPLWALENQERDIRDTMITKSASYSVEYPLRLGAALAGSNSGMADALADIGIPLGTAFQLRDDILGLTGAPAVTGKPAGDDIREGKRTIPLLHAWRRADPAQRAQLASTLGVRDADAAAVAQSVALIQSLGGIEATEREIHELTESGLSRLASLDLAPDNHLATLFTQLTRRDF